MVCKFSKEFALTDGDEIVHLCTLTDPKRQKYKICNIDNNCFCEYSEPIVDIPEQDYTKCKWAYNPVGKAYCCGAPCRRGSLANCIINIQQTVDSHMTNISSGPRKFRCFSYEE
jgi:hypothetical protein